MKWRVVSAIAMAAVLAGCGPADGYRYERSEFDRRELSVTVVPHGSPSELRAEAARIGVSVEQGRELQAFALVDKRAARCTMHVVEPARDYAPEWIGHELVHCLRGRWHP